MVLGNNSFINRFVEATSCTLVPGTPNLQVRFHVLASKVFVGSGLESRTQSPLLVHVGTL